MKKIRNAIIILGDQLNIDSKVLQEADKKNDVIFMAEVLYESTKVPSHKARTTVFLSAMRHFRNELKENGFQVKYLSLSDKTIYKNFQEAFSSAVEEFAPQKIIVTQPGEFSVLSEIKMLASTKKVTLEIKPDDFFLSSPADFANFSAGKKQLRMEYFYREMRKKYSILMEDQKPVGGDWNYDQENRKSFKKEGPGDIPFLSFKKDELTLEVIKLVNELFPNNPGHLENFDWPVTPKEAEKLLNYFIEKILPDFGDWQDAMWGQEPFLFHSRLSVALNLKLIHPLKVIKAAERAYYKNKVSLPAVEGFIRQILGWREYVRGVYFHFMPEYIERNFLKAKEPLPPFFWTGKTSMNCLKSVIEQTMNYGYAHHIQRLMVTGLFSLLYGTHPKEIHEWYLAVYVDAVEWVELPNTLGMSQYGDGGVMASKPYIASGKYVARMSNYCKSCPYSPDESTGEKACPFTTLYWDFIRNHKEMLAKNPRLGMQVKNWDKFSSDKKEEIKLKALDYRKKIRKGNL